MTSASGGPARKAPRNGFVFERASDGKRAQLLGDLVRSDGDGDASLGGVALDTAVLASRMLFGSPTDDQGTEATPYAGIRATYVVSNALPPFEHEALATPVAAAARLRTALEVAVAHALDGARRVAVLAGGGVDSSALLALALRWARKSGAEVFAVAMDFGGRGDDRPYLTALARHLGCEVHRVEPRTAAERVGLFLRGADATPFTWPSGPLEVEALARAKAHGAELVLTGVGADELLDGEPRDLSRLALRAPRAALTAARAMRGFERPQRPVFSWIARPLLAPFVPASLGRWRRRRHAPAPPVWAGPALLSAWRERRALDENVETSRPLHARSSRSIWALPHHEHLAWLRHQEDAEAQIETRQVFLESSLRALVHRMPPEWLVQGSIRRGLFREAVRDLLPAVLVERTDKASFDEAHAAWLDAAGGIDLLQPLGSGEELARLGLVERASFRRAFDAFARAPTDGEGWASLWPALAVESFVREHARQRNERARS